MLEATAGHAGEGHTPNPEEIEGGPSIREPSAADSVNLTFTGRIAGWCGGLWWRSGLH